MIRIKVRDYNSDIIGKKDENMNEDNQNNTDTNADKKEESSIKLISDKKEELIDQIYSTEAQINSVLESEFLRLKDIEGKVIHNKDEDHSTKKSNNEDFSDHKVHFRIDLNQEKEINEIIPIPLSVKHDKVKSILKRKKQIKASGPVSLDAKVDNFKKVSAIDQSVKIFQESIIKEATKNEIKLIMNSSEFLSTWKHIKSNQEASFKFLEGLVKPERIPNIFKEGIEIDLFVEILIFMKNNYLK